MAENGYVGKIQHTGVQVVKAPSAATPKSGKASVKTGEDLRSKGN